MGPGVMIYTYVRNFIKIGSGIQKLIGGEIHTRTQQRDLISPLCFFKIRKVG
jgi:hypothetical protein